MARPAASGAGTTIIKSTDREVRTLLDALASDDARREAAIARLIIIGPRAIARLIAAFESSPDRLAQLAMLRVLEAVGDDRALPIARRALVDGGDLAVAAVCVLQELLSRASLSVQAEALDALVGVTADSTLERRVRVAATQVVEQVSRAVAPALPGARPETLSSSEATWSDAADGHLPDDPAILRAAAAEHAERAPLPIVHRIIEALRRHEQRTRSLGHANALTQAQHWRGVRGALHQVLAVRGSRIALYDLRETLETGEPLPASFLGALQTIGDTSCLESIATALARSRGEPAAWRHQLATAFHMIAKRQRLTPRHPAVRRALAKSPALKGTATNRSL